jgi:predicted hotdog family 3-hydroxylacyl-ACP dehydratase
VVIDSAIIRTLIPHSGTMCLLEEVIAWDTAAIHCLSSTHRDAANPLRRDRQLSAVHAFEYAAQAAAIHGALCARAARQTAPWCYLAAIRDATLYVTRLDDVAERLEVRARHIFGERGNTVYQCEVNAGGRKLADGRITIMARAEPGK